MSTDGTVIVYDEATGMGVILSHEKQEKQYRFMKKEWQSTYSAPQRGIIVSFEPAGSAAMEIMAVGISSTIK